MAKKGKKPKTEKCTLAKWLIDKFDTDAYRTGKLEKNIKHPKADQEMLNAIGGLQELLKQAEQLEKEGLIDVHWKNVRTEIEKMDFAIEDMERLCAREGVKSGRERWLSCHQELVQLKKSAKVQWLEAYYESLLRTIETGKIPQEEIEKKGLDWNKLLDCLEAIAGLEKECWRRQFSAQVLHASKEFERKYQNKVVAILKEYSSFREEQNSEVDGDADEILAEYGILTYSQSLEIKGSFVYEIDGKAKVDISKQIYGAVLNAQTLVHAKPVSLNQVKKIITIENKANYEDMAYDPECLYIYVHGFPSPKERRFLLGLLEIAPANIEVSHWGDLDYGGIRIYNYLKKHLFPQLTPWHMDREAYMWAIEHHYGIELKKDKREKLEKMDAGDLEDLKACILECGMEVEQECMLEGIV